MSEPREHYESGREPAAASALESGGASDGEFAAAEQMLQDSTASDSVSEPTPRTAAPSSPEEVRELDAALAAQAEALLDMPLPFESVDETLAAPPPRPVTGATVPEAPAEMATPSPAPAAAKSIEADHDPAVAPPDARPEKSRSDPVRKSPAPAEAMTERVASAPPSKSAHIGPLTRTLMAINAPLRIVPAPLRPVVDVIALTLVFWAPVVWVLALFVFNEPR